MVLQFASRRIFPEHHLDEISAAAVDVSAHALPNASRIIDGLYIGDFRLALQTAKGCPSLLRMVVPLVDTPEEDILQVLEPCFKFIDEGRKHGTVLVHCMAGKSRSAAIVTAYLMRSLRLSMKQAMEMVNRNYKKASPNVGYIRQLEQFEMQLQKVSEGLVDYGKSLHTPG